MWRLRSSYRHTSWSCTIQADSGSCRSSRTDRNYSEMEKRRTCYEITYTRDSGRYKNAKKGLDRRTNSVSFP